MEKDVGADATRRRSGRSRYVGPGALLMLQRKFPDALAVLKQLPQDVSHYDRPREFFEGAIYTFLNDKEKALSAFEQARPIAEKACARKPE